MIIEEIRANAPQGATHWDGEEYWQYYNDLWWVYENHYSLWEQSKPYVNDLISLK